MYAGGLPFGPPDHERYKDTLRMPDYRRVDIGFSKQIIGKGSIWNPGNARKYIRSCWVSLDVFNLIDANNTVSYNWVKDAQARQYAIPNYLTTRQLNLRLVIEIR